MLVPMVDGPSLVLGPLPWVSRGSTGVPPKARLSRTSESLEFVTLVRHTSILLANIILFVSTVRILGK